MKKRHVFFSLISVIILLALPYIIYLINFINHSMSKNTSDWGSFGDYINGMLVPITALIGLLLTYVIYKINNDQNQRNIKRQELVQRPLLYISFSDYEDNLEINIYNKGIGPLLITEYKIIDKSNNKIYNSIYQVIENIGGIFDNYTGNMKGLVLYSKEQYNLFKYTNENKNRNKFEQTKQQIRKIFISLQFQIRYVDVYGNEMTPYPKDLDWFKRNLEIGKSTKKSSKSTKNIADN